MIIKSAETQRAFGPDLIRATAIILVLFAHTFPGGVKFPVLGAIRDGWGFWGVEIFFVLSGYLIGGILITDLYEGHLNSLGGVGHFWKRRWFRTLPNYFLFLCLFLMSARIDDGQFPPDWKDFLWFGQALLSPYPGFFLVAWSLAIEEWFYLLFPVVLLVCSKLTARRERAILAAIALFLIGPMICRSLMENHAWDLGIRMVTLPRLDAITYGVVLAFVKNHHAALWKLLARAWPVGAVLTAALFGHACWHMLRFGTFDAASVFYRVFYFCLISLGIALLFPAVVNLTAPANWWTTVIRKFSLWSYSMYLTHTFFIWLILQGYALAGWQVHPGSGLIVLRDVLDWMLTIPFSAMLYRYFEKPCMDLRDRTWKTSARTVAESKPNQV